MKRDVLLEAASDIEYLVQVREGFRSASAAAARDAKDYTLRLVRELVDGGYCRVATWTGGPQAYGGLPIVEVTLTEGELEHIVARYEDHGTNPFDYFLVATDHGRGWVARHDELVGQL